MGLPARHDKAQKLPPSRPPAPPTPLSTRLLAFWPLVLALLFWALIASLNILILGAYLSTLGVFERPRLIFLLGLGLTCGLPVALALQPREQGIRWGGWLNCGLLLVLMLLEPTRPVMRQHGRWMLDWMSHERGYSFQFALAESLTRLGDKVSVTGAGLAAALGEVLDQIQNGPAGADTAEEKAAKKGKSGAAEEGGWRARIKDELGKAPDLKQQAAIEKGIVAGVNEARHRAGLPPLKTDARLEKLAREHSDDMLSRDYFKVVTPDGKSPSDRAREAGMEGAEVEAMIGQATGYGNKARDLVQGFLSLSEDRRRLVNPAEASSYQGVGAGLACRETTCLATVMLLYQPGAGPVKTQPGPVLDEPTP